MCITPKGDCGGAAPRLHRRFMFRLSGSHSERGQSLPGRLALNDRLAPLATTVRRTGDFVQSVHTKNAHPARLASIICVGHTAAPKPHSSEVVQRAIPRKILRGRDLLERNWAATALDLPLLKWRAIAKVDGRAAAISAGTEDLCRFYRLTRPSPCLKVCQPPAEEIRLAASRRPRCSPTRFGRSWASKAGNTGQPRHQRQRDPWPEVSTLPPRRVLCPSGEAIVGQRGPREPWHFTIHRQIAPNGQKTRGAPPARLH